MTQINFDEAHIPSNDEIGEIAKLAQLQLERQAAVEALTAQLKDATESLRKVQEFDLPNAMSQAGVSEIKLPNGARITVKEDIYASIPKDERGEQALAWLRDNGFGDVIKTTVTAAFGRGEEESAIACEKEMTTNGWNPVVATTVHSSTLKALLREQLAKGMNIPMDAFAAGPITKAIIK